MAILNRKSDEFQILSQIFAFLSLVDRKTVRLVCRSWYACSISTNITEREKFVFRIDSMIVNVIEVMKRSNYKWLNLEFQGLVVSNIPASAWKACGERIRTLAFHSCGWQDETMKNIILYCENLRSFVVGSLLYNRWNNLDSSQIPYSPRLLKGLIRKGIQRPNLHTLSIFTDEEELRESVLGKIFLIHPCIKHFCVRTRPYAFVEPDQRFSPVARLESLAYNLLTDGAWMEALVDKTEQGLGFVPT